MVYFFLYSGFRFKLYTSLANEYLKKDKQIKFVVQDIHTYVRLIIGGIKKKNIFLIRFKTGYKYSTNNDLKKNIDVLSYNMNAKYASKLYWITIEFLKSLPLTDNDILYCGNGSHVQDEAIKNCQRSIGFQTIFTELSNIEGKTFFDPVGVNCNSLFYTLNESDISELRESYDSVALKSWELNYIQSKKKKHNIKQAQRRSRKELAIYYISTIIDIVFGIPSYDSLRVKSGYTKINPARRKNDTDRHKTDVEIQKLKFHNYMFFPLQVTNDAQILINSNYDNTQALEYYLGMSKKMGLDLVVKIHPAERNIEFIDKISKIVKETDGIYISKKNTFELILESECVGVNNSTVGFEGIICGKPTYFIGKTFYSKLSDPAWRYFYIDKYLFNKENDIISKVNELIKMKK